MSGYTDCCMMQRAEHARTALLTEDVIYWKRDAVCREKALTAHLISPANGAAFTMYLADAQADSKVLPAQAEIER